MGKGGRCPETRTGRYARCETPKPSWGSSACGGTLESRVLRKAHARFGEGRMEKCSRSNSPAAYSTKVTSSAEWKDLAKQRGWIDLYMPSDAVRAVPEDGTQPDRRDADRAWACEVSVCLSGAKRPPDHRPRLGYDGFWHREIGVSTCQHRSGHEQSSHHLASLSLRRAIVAALLAVVLLPGAVHAAPEAGLRSFTAPPARDDDRPRPDKAPLVGVERRALPPPGAEALSGPAGDTKFTLACSAAEAAATSLTTPIWPRRASRMQGAPNPSS